MAPYLRYPTALFTGVNVPAPFWVCRGPVRRSGTMAVRPGVGIVPTYVPNIHTSAEIFS